MPIPIDAFIDITHPSDTHATHLNTYGKGGHKVVSDNAAMLAITPERREEGMTVYQTSTGLLYRLVGGIGDGNFTLEAGRNKYDATADPTITNDSSEGYAVDSKWLNTSTGHYFTCIDASLGAANWKRVYPAGAIYESAEYIPPSGAAAGHMITSDAGVVGHTKDNFTATREPLRTDDETQGYGKGSMWFVAVADPDGFALPYNRGVWVCSNPATNKAQWQPVHLPRLARKITIARNRGAIYNFPSIAAAIADGYNTIFAAGFHAIGSWGDPPIDAPDEFYLYGFPQLGCYMYDAGNPAGTPMIKVNGSTEIQDVIMYSEYATDSSLIEVSNGGFFSFNNRSGNLQFRYGGIVHLTWGAYRQTFKITNISEVFLNGLVFDGRPDFFLDSNAPYNQINNCQFYNQDWLNGSGCIRVSGQTDLTNCIVRAPAGGYRNFKKVLEVTAPADINIKDTSITAINDTAIDINSNDCTVNVSGLSVLDLPRNYDILVRAGKTGNLITVNDSSIGIVSVPAGNTIVGQYQNNRAGGEVNRSLGPIGGDELVHFSPTGGSPTLTILEGDRHQTIIADTTANAGVINLPPINIVGPPLRNSNTRKVTIFFLTGGNSLNIAPDGTDKVNQVAAPYSQTLGTSITYQADESTLSWYTI